MANLTITVPAEVLKGARRRALEQGTSVNAVLRDYLSQFAGAQSAQVILRHGMPLISRLALSPQRKACRITWPVAVAHAIMRVTLN